MNTPPTLPPLPELDIRYWIDKNGFRWRRSSVGIVKREDPVSRRWDMRGEGEFGLIVGDLIETDEHGTPLVPAPARGGEAPSNDWPGPRDYTGVCRRCSASFIGSKQDIVRKLCAICGPADQPAPPPGATPPINWEREVQSIIDHIPGKYVIRCCEGGGPESLPGTLALTVLSLLTHLADEGKQTAAQAAVAEGLRAELTNLRRMVALFHSGTVEVTKPLKNPSGAAALATGQQPSTTTSDE